MTATPAQVAHYASLAAQAEQHVAGLGLDALIDAADADRVRQLAQAVDCITESDLCALAAISPATAETWRKRGKAPPYLILGNRALYLRKGLQEFIERQAKQPREGVVARRQQLERIAGLTWGDVACAIRALGMPEASEDFTRVCRALHHVVGEVGYDNAEELLQSLDIAAECAEELRLPDLPSEREQADADARDRAERVYEARRDV